MAKPDTVFQFPENYPDVLEQMGQVIGRTLLKHGLKKPEAQTAAFEAIEGIRSEVGGAMLYVNKGLSYELSLRDREIWDKFKGDNYLQLAQEYKLSEMQVRNIINAVRARELAKRQGALSFE